MRLLCSTVILVAALVVSPSSQQVCDQTLTNNIVDIVITQMVTKFPDSISLQNVSTSFSMGYFELTNGILAGLSSAKRIGDFGLTMDDQMKISLTVGLEDLVVTYQEYYVKAMGLAVSGSLNANIKEVNVFLSATMENKSLCFLYVDKIQFVKLHKLDIDLGKKFASWAVTKAANAFRTNIKSLVEAKLDEALKKILDPDVNGVVCKN